MVRSPVKAHTTAMVQGLIEKAQAMKNIEHKGEKGQHRELLISNFLNNYLPQDFGIGSGIIINQKEVQSSEIDIIIYDKRVLPPFFSEINEGLYPAESVLATIEVKSWLSKNVIKEYTKKIDNLLNDVYDPMASIYRDYAIMKPFNTIVGFYDDGTFNYKNASEIVKEIETWMMSNIKQVFGVCLIGKFSWLRVMRNEGATHLRSDYHEATKAFFAILLDNVRTVAHKRYFNIISRHSDWLSLYIRDQPMKKFFPS